jgi:hypothetical protein
VINQICGTLLDRGITVTKGRRHIEESLASKSKTARISILPILSVVRESFPMLAS